MLRNYFKVALRNLFKNRSSSIINISGLAAGMTVAILIGLWIFDELSFNKSFPNHDRLAKVWQFVEFSKGEKIPYDVSPILVADELRNKYPDFEAVSVVSQMQEMVVANGEDRFNKKGFYVEPAFADMFSLTMLAGSRHALRDMNSVLLSRSSAESIFGRVEAVGKVVSLNNQLPVKVAGVYEDFPANTQFAGVQMLAPWALYLANDTYARKAAPDWDENSFQVFAQLKPGVDVDAVSAKIRDMRMKRDDPPAYKPAYFLHPMDKWHLYSSFSNGVNDGGAIRFVWLFGMIGVFVLLLACINFMNLSTARSEKRAREVGIRKAIGSGRRQLIGQFLSESFMVVLVAMLLSVILVQVSLPFFNEVSGKPLRILWQQPLFWALLLAFAVITGLVAGSYPAFYLSSFRPVKVLKGVFKAGPLAALPRKVLVTFQFAVSVLLIIGTVVVFRQLEHARNRPVGYDRGGLFEVSINTTDLRRNLGPLRTDLLASGAVADMSGASCTITGQDGGTTDFSWEGKKPGNTPLVMSNNVTYDFGKTIGWELVQGRDFSRAYVSDSVAIILNEAAVALTGYRQPIGALVKTGGRQYQIVGVVKNIIRESPFSPVKPTFFRLGKGLSVLNVRLSPSMGVSDAMTRITQVFKQYDPGVPFQPNFVDERFQEKFGDEVRIGKLASCFAVLAIFISCLGLFGLASFVAEKRTKEIGVRKVLGASVFQVWRLLSKEFVVLVLLSLVIAMPVAGYLMQDWLQNYEYRTSLPWWIFGATGVAALLITILTVSFQAIKAALMNPVKSLRSE
ncbi:ABC transporter permease [Paraflavitalea pollutisoli]|uniref:ABC transporter permease n=1 Tax=Paraflavitalea pollutisoli TaxID=3034143 RepID=UPI0023ED5DCB|nr:ABC transporter permease [Paraflavitalea sp. H1-2-19X]